MAKKKPTTTEATVTREHEGTRFERYADIMDPKKLTELHAMVIGVGAIGRQAAIGLATIGVGTIEIVDHDTVGPENFGVQGFPPSSDGLLKVACVEASIHEINPECKVIPHAKRFGRSMKTPGVVFMCVDDMEARKFIMEAISNREAIRARHDNLLVLDARMGAETCQIFAVSSEKDWRLWYDGWFPQSEAAGASCTTKSTLYCASMASSLMLSLLSKHLRGHDLSDTHVVEMSLVDYYCEAKTPDMVRAEIEAEKADKGKEKPVPPDAPDIDEQLAEPTAAEDWMAGVVWEDVPPGEPIIRAAEDVAVDTPITHHEFRAWCQAGDAGVLDEDDMIIFPGGTVCLGDLTEEEQDARIDAVL